MHNRLNAAYNEYIARPWRLARPADFSFGERDPNDIGEVDHGHPADRTRLLDVIEHRRHRRRKHALARPACGRVIGQFSKDSSVKIGHQIAETRHG